MNKVTKKKSDNYFGMNSKPFLGVSKEYENPELNIPQKKLICT